MGVCKNGDAFVLRVVDLREFHFFWVVSFGNRYGPVCCSSPLARLQVQKVSTLMAAQDASLDTVKEAEVTVSRIEAGMVSKRIDVRDIEDGMLAVVGKE